MMKLYTNNKGKIFGLGTPAIVLILAFWKMGIGPNEIAAVGRLPNLEVQVQQQAKEDTDILKELRSNSDSLQAQSTVIAVMASEISHLVKQSDEMRSDIKKLLED